MERKMRIAVLMGGISNEREVSLKSGRAVAQALSKAGHEVIPFDVRDKKLAGLEKLGVQLAFVALHGAFGEDGCVQRLLERMGIPYTGSGPRASSLAMDKIASKRAFVKHSVPTPGYFVVQEGTSIQELTRKAEQLGFPLVCKPSDSGSSLGVRIVKEPAELAEAVSVASRNGRNVFVEQYIRGREFTVGILHGRPLPLVEVVTKDGFFDYRAKYEDEQTTYICPVALIESVYRKALDVGLRAFQCLGCRHFGRVDLRYGYDGNLYVLEVNTIPGFTPRSLLPMAAAREGMGFVELCDCIVRMAAQGAQRLSTMRKAG